MSAQFTTEQALQKIAEEYESRIFFGRLKLHGVVPKNGAEAAELFKLLTFLEKLNQQKQVEEQSELTQLIGRAIERANGNDTQQNPLEVANKASGETLSPELRMAFAIVVQGLAQTG